MFNSKGEGMPHYRKYFCLIEIIDNNYLVCDFPYFSDIPKDTATGSYQEKEVKFMVLERE